MNRKKDGNAVTHGNESIHPVNGGEALAIAAVNAPPSSVPKPPAGWRKKKGGVKRGGRRPKAAQVANGPAVGAELVKNASAYVEDFGKKAPDPRQVAAVFERAAAWSGVLADVTAFRDYASEQATYGWQLALDFARVLAPGFEFAVSRDGAVKDRFPALAKVIASFSRGKSRKPRAKKADGAGAAPAAPAEPAKPEAKAEGTPVTATG